MPVKRYSKDRRTCQVTFSLPPEVGATSAALCGDFNGWIDDSHVMKRAKGGGFSLSVRLPADTSQRYRFLLDGERWENDWAADRYVANEHGSEDSVIDL